MYRQGDVFLKKIEVLPKNLKEDKTGVVLRGESTGHSHRVKGGKLYKDKTGLMYINAGAMTMLVHEEHKPIKLPEGKYAVIRQREYAGKDMVRVVVD